MSNAIYDLGTSSFSGNTLVIHSCTKFTDPTNTDVADPCYPNGKNDLSFFPTFSATQPRLFVMADALGNIGVALLTALGPIGDYLGHETAGPATIIRDVVLLLMGVHLFFVPSIFSIDNLRNRNRSDEEETA